MTLHEKPPNATHWSVRSMAAAAGISYSSVQRIWHAHGLKPHLVETFKVSRDKNFAAKVEDVVGLYLNPPDKALVLCVDEKSQIQALDRTQPGLPMKKGRAGTMTHDYKRNGTTTLFAALNMLDGKVIGACMPRHRHREFLRFLKPIDQQTPANLDLHLIVDNYATHKTPTVKRWLKAHPRFHLHFTPTSASWLNMVERFFAEITRKRIRRGAFKSVAELKSAIMEYLENHNANPKPFIWTKSAGEILEKVARAKQALESQHQIRRHFRGAPTAVVRRGTKNGDLSSLRQRALAIAFGEMLAVGPMAEWLGVEERFYLEFRIVGHEQAALEARLLDASELRQRCGQDRARRGAVGRLVTQSRRQHSRTGVTHIPLRPLANNTKPGDAGSAVGRAQCFRLPPVADPP